MFALGLFSVAHLLFGNSFLLNNGHFLCLSMKGAILALGSFLVALRGFPGLNGLITLRLNIEGGVALGFLGHGVLDPLDWASLLVIPTPPVISLHICCLRPFNRSWTFYEGNGAVVQNSLLSLNAKPFKNSCGNFEGQSVTSQPLLLYFNPLFPHLLDILKQTESDLFPEFLRAAGVISGIKRNQSLVFSQCVLN